MFLEAASMQSWSKWINEKDIFVGLDNFGISGPGKDVFKHFEISIDRIKNEIKGSL